MTGYREGIEVAVSLLLLAVVGVAVWAGFVWLGWDESFAHPELPAIVLTLFGWMLVAGAIGGHYEHKRINSWDGKRWTYPKRWRKKDDPDA